MFARPHVDTHFPTSPFFTITDLVRMGYSRSGWYELAKQGKIKLHKLGGKTIIMREELDRFLSELPEINAKVS